MTLAPVVGAHSSTRSQYNLAVEAYYDASAIHVNTVYL
jgi:hypothetical protein